MIETFIFMIGTVVGSFLNVCIARLPKSVSIVRPGSACLKCRDPIKFYDNIPVLSYFWLRGRCRACGGAISFRYVIIEILGGLSALAVFFSFGLSIASPIYFALISSLFVATFIDADCRIIPDVITIPGVFVGLAASFFLPRMTFTGSIMGALVGGGILYSVAWSYKRIAGIEGMGGGDIKLLAMIGSFTGWKGALFTVFTASIIGTLAGFLIMGAEIMKKRTLKGDENRMKLAIPFGPFLSIAAILYIFFGAKIIDWHLNSFFSLSW